MLINTHEWRTVGMSRSGNHAIVNWFLAQLQGHYCFLNCAEPKTNPFVTARPLDAHGCTYQVNYAGFDLQAEQQGSFTRKDYLLHSYEDCFLGMVNSPAFEENHDCYVGSSGERIDILILRDPFNLFASRIKSGFYRHRQRKDSNGRRRVTRPTGLRIWKQHARQVLGRDYLRQPFVPVLFNRWATDPTYRRELAENLGFTFSDDGFRRVARVGGGSSFDGLSYATRAQDMGLLHRWRHFADDPAFWNVFDEEVFELAEEIFGSMPDAWAAWRTNGEPQMRREVS